MRMRSLFLARAHSLVEHWELTYPREAEDPKSMVGDLESKGLYELSCGLHLRNTSGPINVGRKPP
jgi:hypothetical protein